MEHEPNPLIMAFHIRTGYFYSSPFFLYLDFSGSFNAKKVASGNPTKDFKSKHTYGPFLLRRRNTVVVTMAEIIVEAKAIHGANN